MNIQRFTFFLTDNLLLLYCSVTWSLLTQTDTDWTCWLKADARVWKPNSNLKLTQTAAMPYMLYIAYKQYSAGCCWCVNDGRTEASSHAQEMLPTRFQETAQSGQHWHFDAAIKGFICRKLKIIKECTRRSIMCWRWARKLCSVLHDYKWNIGGGNNTVILKGYIEY